MKQFRKILIANRGEIAVRIAKSCHQLGISVVGIYSDVDKNAPYLDLCCESVFIGSAAASAEFLNVQRIVDIAKETKCDAVHPGYGFMSENAEFAEACEKAGIVFIGPSPFCIQQTGDKIAAKQFVESMKSESRPHCVPGFALNENDAKQLELLADNPNIDNIEAQKISFKIAEMCKSLGKPLLVKAADGGGGKGMRIVEEPLDTHNGRVRLSSTLLASLASARRESAAAFGSTRILLERYISQGRHIEIQIFGDNTGTVLHFYERECSIQRRHQKIVEETPSVALTSSLREAMCAAAVSLGTELGYVGAGTVEFIFDDRSKEFFFLEVNARIQVEHPITEMLTGLDIVALQIGVAQGASLSSLGVTQNNVVARGHAIEVRLNAEDWSFRPQTGLIRSIVVPPEVRVDTGVRDGSVVSVFYDSMIAKLIVHAPDRQIALARLADALRNTVVLGLNTNLAFLHSVLTHPVFVDGRSVSTHFVANHMPIQPPSPPPQDLSFLAVGVTLLDCFERQQKRTLLKHLPAGWRATSVNRLQRRQYSLKIGNTDTIYTRVAYLSKESNEKSLSLIARCDWPSINQFSQKNESKNGVVGREGVVSSNNNEKVDHTEAIKQTSEAFDLREDMNDLEAAEILSVDRVNDTVIVDVRWERRRARIAAVRDDTGAWITRLIGSEHCCVVAVRRLSALAPTGNEDETLSTSARLIDGKRRYTAPTPSKVVKVHVKVGDRVTPGTPLFDLESMKMQTTHTSLDNGVVLRSDATVGSVVAAGALIVETQPDQAQ